MANAIRDDLHPIKTVKLTHTGATVAKTVYLINGHVIMAIESADADVANAYVTDGLIEYTKVGSQAWTVLATVYWDNTNKRFTTSASGNTKSGYAWEAVGSGASATVGLVRLVSSLVS